PVLDGLKGSVLASFDAFNRHDQRRTKTPRNFIAIGRNDIGELITSEVGKDGQEFLGYSRTSGGNRTIYFESRLNYNKTLNNVHHLDGLFLFNLRDYVDQSVSEAIGALPYRNTGIAGRTAYSYADRYFTEFNFGYNGSENFKKGYRFGFFPSVALGWVISNESFMQGMNPWLSFLKLRGSYGLVGNDNLGGRRFAYVSTVNWTGGYQWGYQGDYWRDGLVEGDFGIPDLTWETATKANVGAEIGLFSKFML